MITEEHRKEGLSRAYIMAVAHHAGFNCALREFDYGIDGTFIEVSDMTAGGKVESGFKLDFQAKASIRATHANDVIKYPLEADAFNRLVARQGGTARILILLELPVNPDEWLTLTDEQLVLKRCAWWHSLAGQMPTPNANTQTIQIPATQRFDVPALNALMNRVKAGTL
jgi:hypothetical protein